MGRETVLFKSEERKTSQETASLLRQLAAKVEEGNIILQKGDDSLTVDIPTHLNVEIKVELEQKKHKTEQSLEIELVWIVGDHGEDSMAIG